MNLDPRDITGLGQASNLFWDPTNLLQLRDKDGNYDPLFRNRNKPPAATSPAPCTTQSTEVQPRVEAAPNNAGEPNATLDVPGAGTQKSPRTNNNNKRNNYDPFDPLGGFRLLNLALNPFNLAQARDQDNNYDPWRVNRNNDAAASPDPYPRQSMEVQPRTTNFPNNAIESNTPLPTPVSENHDAASPVPYPTLSTETQPPDSARNAPITRIQNSQKSTVPSSAVPVKTQAKEPPVTRTQESQNSTGFSSALPIEPRAEEPAVTRMPLRSRPQKKAASLKKSPMRAPAIGRLPAPDAVSFSTLPVEPEAKELRETQRPLESRPQKQASLSEKSPTRDAITLYSPTPDIDFSSALSVEPRAERLLLAQNSLKSKPQKRAILSEKYPARDVTRVRLPAPAASHPTVPRQYDIAIVCALSLEQDAVALVLDGPLKYEENSAYATGRIGKHNVILALLYKMGKDDASSIAENLDWVYGVRLVFAVGICGGVPQTNDSEILLGDVVLSKNVVVYDIGSQYPDHFRRKDGIQSNEAIANKDVRRVLALLETKNGRLQLLKETADFLRDLQTTATEKGSGAKYDYPGIEEDKLFRPDYRHKHNLSPCRICRRCLTETDPVCEKAIKTLCSALKCDERYLVRRQLLERKRKINSEKAQDPAIHVGGVGSADMVMKSAKHRDKIARQESIIAFEMEGAGIKSHIPCVVVKGVCDYADCHKNKKWQDFAAATAASALKAVLNRMPVRTRGWQAPPQRYFFVPERNGDFVGRASELKKLLEKIPPSADPDCCQMTTVKGLGGVGKTQIAIEAAYRVRDLHEDCSVFWVSAVDTLTFHSDYREIAEQLKIRGIDEDEADVSSLVKTVLSQSIYSWLLIVDNVDDERVLSEKLRGYFPSSHKGSILFTTRNHMVVSELGIRRDNRIHANKLSVDEATKLLQSNLDPTQTSNTESTRELLGFLDNFPLAIKQASAYMDQTGMTTNQYLKHLLDSKEQSINLLSKDFGGTGRNKNIRNAVATTWLVSFQYISENNRLAAEYMGFMSFLAEAEIPKSLLQWSNESELAVDEAIGMLTGHGFVTEQADQKSYYMHRLVRLAMRNWLTQTGEFQICVHTVIYQLYEVFPVPTHENSVDCVRYLPHALAALEFQIDLTSYPAELDLNAARSHLLYRVEQSISIIMDREFRKKLVSVYDKVAPNAEQQAEITYHSSYQY